jgi:hypothetical protein
MYDNRLPPIPLVTTDGEGRYTLPWLGVPFELAAVHASGFARRSSEQIEATTEIRLARWSRVEGEVRNGNKAAAQSLVMMSSDEPRPPAVWGRDAVDRYGLPARIGAPHFMIDLKTIEVEATTDDAGRFSFERVPPEDMVLRHSVGSQFAHEGLLRVLPGETARITLGGQGRPVTGRVVAPARAKRSIDLAEVSLRGRGPSIQAQPYMPPIPEGLTREGRSDWVERWWHSPEGRDFRAARSPRPVKLEPDGRFRAEDLAAGEYVLEAWFYQGGGTPVEAGFVGHSFTVPPISGGRSDEPLDLGEIPIRLSPLLPHGREIAASFVMLDAPEQRRSLAEYRGKYVVLVCTANWAEIDPVEREQLRELFVSGNKTEKVVVLGLSFDDTIEEARAAPARAATPWPQAYAGPWETGDVAEGLGLGSIPRIIVIDPQGRFLSRSLSIPVIRRLFSR